MSGKTKVPEDVLNRILAADTRPEYRSLIESALAADEDALAKCKDGNVTAAIARLRKIGQPRAAWWLDTCRNYAACV